MREKKRTVRADDASRSTISLAREEEGRGVPLLTPGGEKREPCGYIPGAILVFMDSPPLTKKRKRRSFFIKRQV